MYVSYSILAVAVLIVLAFTVLNLVSNTSGLKNTLIGIGAFVVLSLICYFGFANGVESSLKDGNILSCKSFQIVISHFKGCGLKMRTRFFGIS